MTELALPSLAGTRGGLGHVGADPRLGFGDRAAIGLVISSAEREARASRAPTSWEGWSPWAWRPTRTPCAFLEGQGESLSESGREGVPCSGRICPQLGISVAGHPLEQDSLRARAQTGSPLGVALDSMLSQLESAFAQRAAVEPRRRQFVSDAFHELRPAAHLQVRRRGAGAAPRRCGPRTRRRAGHPRRGSRPELRALPPRGSRAEPDRGGSGLGLSIVAALVAAHCGRVGVDGTPGGGAAFRIELPLTP